MIRPALLITGVLLVLLAANLGWGVYSVYYSIHSWTYGSTPPPPPHPEFVVRYLNEKYPPPVFDVTRTAPPVATNYGLLSIWESAGQRRRNWIITCVVLASLGVTLIAAASIRRIPRDIGAEPPIETP